MACVISYFFSQLDPKSVWLKDVAGSRCFFPSGETFEIDSSHAFALLVQGSPRIEKATSLATSATNQDSASSSSGQFHKGGFASNSSTITIRVIKAQMKQNTPNGKVDFKLLDTVHITSTANIPYIQSQVEEKWGQGFSIVSNDGLPIGDSKATRGTYNYN